MIQVAIGQYHLSLTYTGLPITYEHYVKQAQFVDEFDLKVSDPYTALCFVGVGHQRSWPSLVVTQSYSPSSGFHPGVLVVPETQLLFIGAGERLLLYDLVQYKRLWQDETEIGFLGWQRHGDYVIMSAELELAAWATTGEKLWTTFVEPPWDYSVENGQIMLDIMGNKSVFPIDIGPHSK